MMRENALRCLVVALGLVISPVLATAQNAGFRVAIAQPAFAFPPTQAPAVATHGTFVGRPAMTPPVPQAIGPISPVPTFPTVIVPNQILVPGQTMVPVVQPTPGPVPAGNHRFPSAGTSRSEVLRQFG